MNPAGHGPDGRGARDGPRTLVLHDYFEAPEGGGRLALALARGLGADLACGFLASGHPFFRESFPGRLRQLGSIPRLPLWRQAALARGFARRADFLAEYDAAVFSGSYAPLAVLRHRPARTVLYCHTPPRFLYEDKKHFEALAPAPMRPLLMAFTARLRPQYKRAARAMDVVVANSETVRARIRRHLGLEARVVHPPCDTGAFQWQGQEDFYLSFARLDRLKRVERIVEAFATLPDRRLVVASGGPELEAVRRKAAGLPNVEVLGPVEESVLRDLLGRCTATVYVPRDEDFGMSPVESMAAGKPVIGTDEGGLAETVLPGRTGLLIPPACDPGDIARAVLELDGPTALSMREACRDRAMRYDTAVFLRGMAEILQG